MILKSANGITRTIFDILQCILDTIKAYLLVRAFERIADIFTS